MTLIEHLNLLEPSKKEKILPIIEYIQISYKQATFHDNYSPKTQIPMWWIGDKYVGIACRKQYISIYFSNTNCIEIISNEYEFCKANKGCVNLKYTKDLPLNIIFKAIDCCFEK